MSKTEVCLLAGWETDRYEKWLYNQDVLRELAVAPADERDELRSQLQADGEHPNCRNHRHVPFEKARQMVYGTKAYAVLELTAGGHEWCKFCPVAKWIRADGDTCERRMVLLALPPATLRGMSARFGLDRQGNAKLVEGTREVMSILASDGDGDWVGPMLSQVQRPRPRKSGMRTGDTGRHRLRIPNVAGGGAGNTPGFNVVHIHPRGK